VIGAGANAGMGADSDADVAGWSWTDLEGDYEDSDGVRWGSFLLTGAFAGTTFTPSEVRPATAYQQQELESFDIPCPEPDGGWRVVDPARVTDERYSELSNVAEGLPGFALIAVSDVDGSPGPTDPFETVVTVYVAGDPTAAEEVFRRAWGGMLCVAQVDHSHAELTQIQEELLGLPGLIEVGSGNPNNQVELTVFHDDGTYQRWADEKYGKGFVVVRTILQPTT